MNTRIWGKSFDSDILFVWLLICYLFLGTWHVFAGYYVEAHPMLLCLGMTFVAAHAHLPERKS